ncbi:hypothetical protein BDY19DRAFT_928558 [Irpex rosettiformis]|uniref:Uncharacterized protein n=1 Tax=Irpex rosettiformis TaxID=378272 RepID=A0ACB8UD46_9APHY|nr:hypothetical protein BDY19DRAFT_928558 [Irpex rosettiformis]
MDVDKQAIAASQPRGDQFFKEISLPPHHPHPDGTPEPLEVTVHVSDTFGQSFKAENVLPNIIILSRDSIFFLAHFHKLFSSSSNNFGCLISPAYGAVCNDPEVDALELCLPESASVLNVLLCTVYGLTCEHYHPTFECLLASLEALKKYGFSLSRYLLPGLPLYNVFLNHISLHPLETYAIAAENNLEDLAVVSSSYTLACALCSIPDHLIPRIGFVYLQRLYGLHYSRVEALKKLLDVALYSHTAKPYCSPRNRLLTNKAFLFAGIRIYYNATPGRSCLTIRAKSTSSYIVSIYAAAVVQEWMV